MTDSHTHHWLLTSHGPASPAVCRDCGAEREFSGGATDFLAEGESWRSEQARRASVTAHAAKRRKQEAIAIRPSEPGAYYREIRRRGERP